MLLHEQGATPTRYAVIPRTLSFILCDQYVLLLRGAPHKRLWANRLNGLGGHLEPNENVLEGALREIREEAGLSPERLDLCVLVHVAGDAGTPGVMLYVFVGEIGRGPLAPSPLELPMGSSREGALAWYPLADLPVGEMVEDLPLLLPTALAARARGGVSYGHYAKDRSGRLAFRFAEM